MAYPVIKFGTPAPVKFTEKAGLELEAFVAFESQVREYDENRYASFEALKSELFASISGLIGKSLSAFPKGDGVARRADKESVLAGLLASELEKLGVVSSVCVRAFWLTPESNQAFAKEFGRAYGAGPAANEKPAAGADRFCRMCGTRRTEGAKFCPECGGRFEN